MHTCHSTQFGVSLWELLAQVWVWVPLKCSRRLFGCGYLENSVSLDLSVFGGWGWCELGREVESIIIYNRRTDTPSQLCHQTTGIGGLVGDTPHTLYDGTSVRPHTPPSHPRHLPSRLNTVHEVMGATPPLNVPLLTKREVNSLVTLSLSSLSLSRSPLSLPPLSFTRPLFSQHHYVSPTNMSP